MTILSEETKQQAALLEMFTTTLLDLASNIEGEDGERKRQWLAQKYLSTMEAAHEQDLLELKHYEDWVSQSMQVFIINKTQASFLSGFACSRRCQSAEVVERGS